MTTVNHDGNDWTDYPDLHATYVKAPITHPDSCTSQLRIMYAAVIAYELEALASAPQVTAELLLDRAAYLRSGIASEVTA